VGVEPSSSSPHDKEIKEMKQTSNSFLSKFISGSKISGTPYTQTHQDKALEVPKWAHFEEKNHLS
jgi:hypothetical protein